MQICIDSAKRSYDININDEIRRIQKDMDISKNGYPIFWKHIKDTRDKNNIFDKNKINKKLICPMNYLINLKFKKPRSNETELPMSYFFQKFELDESRRKCKNVERLIEQYSLNVLNSLDEDDDYECLVNRDDFECLIDDIKQTYISKNYIGLMSWLIDRAFMITPRINANKNNVDVNTNKNKSLLLKVLYEINSNNILKIFSKNVN